jgi:hypothetical protein
VRTNPDGSLSSGVTNFAITPAMNPMMIVQMMCMPISLKCGLPNWGQDDVDVAASVELNGTCGSTEAILGGLSRGRQLALTGGAGRL